MKKVWAVTVAGVLGVMTGAGIAEFFPGMFQSGIVGDNGNIFNDTFSQYRNELALKYGFTGLVIGLIIGTVIAVAWGKK